MLKVEREIAEKMARKLNDDETVLLISYVHSKACLWNENHTDFKRINITRRLWNEIGAQLNITGDEAKTKWKYLRDKFKNFLRKRLEGNKGSDFLSTAPPPAWKFYNSMLFLKDGLFGDEQDSLTTSMIKRNTPKTLQNGQQNEDNDFEELDFDFLVPSTVEINPGLKKAGPRSSKRPVVIEEVDDKNQQPEEKKILSQLTVGNQDDRNCNDDHHFLLSLMPYIRVLEPVEKLELRSQMQNLVTASFKKQEANKRSRMYH